MRTPSAGHQADDIITAFTILKAEIPRLRHLLERRRIVKPPPPLPKEHATLSGHGLLLVLPGKAIASQHRCLRLQFSTGLPRGPQGRIRLTHDGLLRSR